MTVANNTNKVREDGNGSKTAFTFSFEVFDESELEVYKVVKATGVATLQTITTDYTVALNASSPGGTVTYVTAPSALQESFIKRVVPITQETDIPNVGGIREEQIENQLDRGVMIDQQLQEQIDRCPKLPDASTLSDLELPAPEASKYIGWNADADELENKAAPTAVDYLGNIAFGADASKSASPAQGDIYFATDTGKLYLCLSGGTWTWYSPTTMTTRGDIEFYGASGKSRLAAGTAGQHLKTQGAGADPIWANETAGGVLGAYKNLKVVRDSVTQVTVTADELILEDASNNKVTIRSVSEAIAITTSGASGLDTGAEGSSRWYYIWIIRKSSDGTVNGLLSESSSAPTMPSGYDQKALVGAVYNSSGSDFVDFIQEGRRYSYKTSQTMASGNVGTGAWTSITTSQWVPSALSTFCRGIYDGAGTATLVMTNDSGVATGSGAAANKYFSNAEGMNHWEFHILTANTLYWGSSNAGHLIRIEGFEINKLV